MEYIRESMIVNKEILHASSSRYVYYADVERPVIVFSCVFEVHSYIGKKQQETRSFHTGEKHSY